MGKVLSNVTKDKWLTLGPLFVIIGAALWGTESFFRVNLNEKFDSEVLVFHEHLFCIAFTLPLLFVSWKKSLKAPLSSWIYLFLSGSVGSALGTTFFTLSLAKLNASVANVLLNFQPLVSILFANLLLKEKLGRGFFVWAVLALVFGGVIASDGFKFSLIEWNVGLLYVLITALAWGFATVAGRGAMLHLPLTTATAGRFIIGAVTLLVSLLIKGKFVGATMKWEQLSEVYVLKNYFWLSFMAGVVPLYFYFKGLSKTSASVGGFCELTQTFSALVLTWGVMHQSLTLLQVVAGCFLLGCVYMVNLNFAKANA